MLPIKQDFQSNGLRSMEEYVPPGPYIVSLILNNNRCGDTLACLESFQANTYLCRKEIVLDNHSTDGSMPTIRSAYPEIQIIELVDNLGYAGNNNIGIKAALDQQADWVFIVNEDTVLAPDCLTELVKVGESDPKIGIVGPMVYHYDEPNVIQSAGGIFGRYWESIHLAKNEPDNGQFCEPHPVEWITGCAILVRRAVIEQVGMIDEQFFLYWEEAEWCLRAGKAGWRIMHVPQAKLWHKGVQRNYQPNPSVIYYGTRNRFLLLAKHHASLTTWVVAWAQTVRTIVSWSVKPKWRSKREYRNAMWRGMVDFLCHRWGKMPS
jgi:GT2 family glycosyltransferase